MSWFGRIFSSSVGSKYLMAISGIVLTLFLVGHLSGNLLVFAGPDALNEYAANLRKLPFGLLWVARIGLLIFFVMHVAMGIRLSAANRAARPVPYATKHYIKASFASRTMIYTGLLVLVYLIYHLLHFTFFKVGGVEFKLDALGRHDVYSMVIEGFRNPLLSGFYVLAQLVLGLHLSHGLKSMFQSLGANRPQFERFLAVAAPVVAWGMAIGFIAIPVSILFGFVG